MGIFASDKDEQDAYRTSDGMVGRSIRRGTDKAIRALTLLPLVRRDLLALALLTASHASLFRFL